MEEFLKNSAEIKNFGFNILTLSFLGTIFFSCLQGWSLFKQGKKIWDFEDGRSVSIVQFGYWAAYFFAVIPYGFSMGSIALIFNGLVGIPCVYILLGLWKFKDSERWYEWPAAISFLAIIVIMIVADEVTEKEMIFSVSLFGVFIFGLFQIYEIWKEKDTGSVDIGVQKIFIATSVFWLIYSARVGNIPLLVFNPISIVMNIVIIFLYKKYKGAAQ